MTQFLVSTRSTAHSIHQRLTIFPLIGRRRLSHHIDAWQVPSDNRALLGSRCLVLSSQCIDERLQDRMCFELQRQGIQPMRFRLPATYWTIPDATALEDAVELFRRAGCRSIISMGTAIESDASKALRACLEYGKGKGKSMESLPFKFSTRKEASVAQLQIPLVCVATTISPAHNQGTYGLLHGQEHTIEMREWRAPEFVAADCEAITNAHHYSAATAKAYLVAHFLDLLFACSYRSIITRAQATGEASHSQQQVKSLICDGISQQEMKHLLLLLFNQSDDEIEPVALARNLFTASSIIGRVRNNIVLNSKTSMIGALPYVPSLLAPVSTANFIAQGSQLVLPYSYVQILALQQLLELVDSQAAATDSAVDRAALIAVNAFKSLLLHEGSNHDTSIGALKTIAQSGVNYIQQQLRSNQKKFQRKLPVVKGKQSSRLNLSASSCLELYSITAQGVAEDIHQTDAVAAGADLSQVGEEQERMRLLLESNLLVDINEATSDSIAMIV